MNWFKRPTPSPVDEDTRDRRELIAQQRRKLRDAERLAANLRAHDRVNNYSQRLRHAYAITIANEGTHG